MKNLILFIAFLGCSVVTIAQNIGIGTATPHASAMLDVTSVNKGLLVPRVTQANRPASPATGLLIYQTNNTPGFYYYNGSAWQMLGGGSGFSLPYTGSTAGNALNITSTDGIGITGASSAATGNWYGGQFTSASTAGSGVYGAATAATGTTYGGQFTTLSTNGRGVYGGANAATGNTYGGYFLSQSADGRGVYGLANAATGLTRGGQFESNSTNGTGVYGIALSTSGDARGGEFVSNSSEGRGVYGEATSFTGTTRGGEFVSNSSNGTGVVGYSTSVTGQTFGVTGRSNSIEGKGIYGFAASTTGNTIGVFGESNSTAGTGVYGLATNSGGVTTGVLGKANSPTGAAVWGIASSNTGRNFGVLGETSSPIGFGGYFNNYSIEGVALKTANGQVQFDALAGIGTRMVVANDAGRLSTQALAGGQWVTNGNNIYNSNSGNVGIGTNPLFAKLEVASESGASIIGWANATSGFVQGVTGYTLSSEGIAIFGHAVSTTGENYGVRGSTNSVRGTGVWGDGSLYGVWGTTNSLSGVGGSFRNNNSNDGVALQTTQGNVEFSSLSGIGTRMVVANNYGLLSTQPLGVSINTAFQVVTSAANTSFNTTRLSYPNPSINDMVTVTPVWTGTYLKSPIGVFFTEGEWRVFRQDEVDMPLGVKFNVIVIRQ